MTVGQLFSLHMVVLFFKQKTAYEMRISDWSSDVCSSDLRGSQATAPSKLWDDALTAAVTDPDPASRARRVAAWADLPHARFAHPREEHLLPLMVALGAAGKDKAVRNHGSTVLGWTVSGYRFG